MMLQTGSCHCFSFLFLLFTLPLSPTLAYFLKNCNILTTYENVTAGAEADFECEHLNLSSIPDDIPIFVISLTLEHNKIQKIHRADFYHLSNLRYLSLRYNSITHVDDLAFVTLVQLKWLHMDYNKLTTLTVNMFQGLSNLLILSLVVNNITSINPAAFQSLTSLQELRLKPNQMTDIIPVLQLPSLQVLNIVIDELESFQSKDLPLNMSSKIRELKLTSKSIKRFSITTAIFPHLKTIDLADCCNGYGWDWDIPDKYFLRNITKVYLIGSNISFNTTRKALQNLDSLENLQLGFNVWIDRDLLNVVCKIPTLRTLNVGSISANLSETLSHCTQLTNLDLSLNHLTELSKDSITQMKQLSLLNLALNKFSKVPDEVKNLSMLQILDLSFNRINELSCSDFLDLTRLTRLHLHSNKISEIKLCVFQHLNELKVLTLNSNLIIWYGPTFRTGLQKLEWMEITTLHLERDFMNLKSLKHLNIEYYTYAVVPQWNNSFFEGLDELDELSLNLRDYPFKMSSSPPHELQWQDCNTTLLQSLKRLTIRFGPNIQIKYIVWDMLSHMKHLDYLYVVHGQQPDPDSFRYVPRLKTLFLRNSNVKSLNFLAQANLTRLSWLDLSNNELTVINVSVFSFLPALRFIQMNDNPLACDCSNADFQQWMQNNNQTLVVDAHLYTCGFPLDKNGTRFLDFDIHSCLVDASFICYISSTCVIVLTLLTSFTYHFLRLHLFYAYYLFLAFLYDAKERKRGSPQRYDAFISYNVHDELWVYREMLPVLEGEQGWRLCLHHRDFPPGKPIIENITDAIYGSRKIICVISHHYLESEWCSREIQMASYRLFDEQKDVLILVFLEDIPAHQLSPYYHVKRLVKSHTYLSWSQAGQHPGLFWQNLRRALDTPHAELTSSIN